MEMEHVEIQRIKKILKKHDLPKLARGMRFVRKLNAKTAERMSTSSNTNHELPPSVAVKARTTAKGRKKNIRVICGFCGVLEGQPCKTSTGRVAKQSHAERKA